jgi:hypothetical protein
MNNKKTNLSLIFFILINVSSAHTTVCLEEIQQLPLDKVSEIGFSGQDLLDNIAPGKQSENWGWEYKDGKTEVTVVVEKLVNFARYVQKTPSDNRDPAISCLSHLEVDVRLDITSADQTLNESFKTVILKTEPLENSQSANNTHMWHTIKGREFTGEIRNELGEPYSDSEFYFYGTFNLSFGFIMYAFTLVPSGDKNSSTYVSIGGTLD